jgi:hypothetical protein
VSRSAAIARASDYFDSGDFLADLARRVAFRTESGVAARRPELLAYLEQEMVPAARRLGADNKGQHTINLAAIEHVLHARGGRPGFNLKILIETSEETGSPGLGEFRARHAGDLAANLLVASDGPRVAAGRPTVFLGSRGSAGFEPGLTTAERAYGANTLEVLSLAAGNPGTPVNAIPGSAHAHCHAPVL